MNNQNDYKTAALANILRETTIDAEVINLFKEGFVEITSNKLAVLTTKGRDLHDKLATKCIDLIDSSSQEMDLIRLATEQVNRSSGLNMSTLELFTSVLRLDNKTEARLLAFLVIEEKTEFNVLKKALSSGFSKPNLSVVKTNSDPEFH
jgi:hypothetical protein